MQYLGGKHRTADEIAEDVAFIVRPKSVVYEPFCGGLSVAEKLAPRVHNIGASFVASDANRALITTIQAVMRRTWKPPHELSENRYEELKAANDPDNPETAFAAAGCSFGGKWWGGYARCRRGYNYIAAAARSLERKCAVLRDSRAAVVHADFWHLTPAARDTVYCDPPYADSVGYGMVDLFDHPAFWARCYHWSQNNIGVRVSEYTCGAAGEPTARPSLWEPSISFGDVQILGRSRGAELVRADVLWRVKGCL